MNKSYKILEMQNGELGIYTNDDKMNYVADLPKKVKWLKSGDISYNIVVEPMYERYEPHTFKHNAVYIKCPMCDMLHT